MNFVERILEKGFKRFISSLEQSKGRYDLRFNPNNGWMGVTIYHPFEMFTKDDKQVFLSLERFGVKETSFNADGTKTETTVNEKHIWITIDGETVYLNKYGVLPPAEVEKMLYVEPIKREAHGLWTAMEDEWVG